MRARARLPFSALLATTALSTAWFAASCATGSAPTKIAWFGAGTRGHSHNDYGRRAPLHEALRHGFCSVEADVFLRDGLLLVGHDEWMLHPSRTLESLYLDPLRECVRAHGGTVHGDGRTFMLLVDIKQQGDLVYARLREVLEQRREMLTRFSAETIEAGAVTVVLSGDRPTAIVAQEATRLVAIDGRLTDLDRKPPLSLVPLVSSPWRNTFAWAGRDEMPPEEMARLRELVEQVHGQGRMLRFWGAPDRTEAWIALRDAGVDWVNTDRPREFDAWRTGSPR